MVWQWCVASNNGITVERPERNPYWFSDRMLLVMRWSSRSWCIKNLTKNWEKGYGAKDCTTCGVESLGIDTILEDFHSAGDRLSSPSLKRLRHLIKYS